jgi:hypothetical protein
MGGTKMDDGWVMILVMSHKCVEIVKIQTQQIHNEWPKDKL